MNKRKICVLTGTRAEYGLLKSVMKNIQESEDLELQIVAVGMHLSEEFGSTYRDIEKDGFRINAKVEMNPEEDTGKSMAQGVSKGIKGISDALEILKPDVFLVLGDRIEPLAGVIAAAYMNIPIAHIHGGDITKGGLDESVRHAITKFSHIHFPVTKKSAERVIKLGEDGKKVFVVGAPGLDNIISLKPMTEQELKRKFRVEPNQYILFVQHSVSTQPAESNQQIIESLEALKETGMKVVAIFPNSDAGGREIIKQLEIYSKDGVIIAFKSLERSEYLSLLMNCSVLVGNSSSGVIESSLFKIPVVNIGIRQEGRERANNVIDAEHSKESILNAIRQALSDDFKKSLQDIENPYGDGKAGERIAKILSEIEIDDKLIQKKITY